MSERLPACLPAGNLARLLRCGWSGSAVVVAACLGRSQPSPFCHCQPPLATLPPACPARSLGYLVNKNRGEQLQEVVGALCSKLLTSNKEQLRDVASLGLKTVVAGGWVAT